MPVFLFSIGDHHTSSCLSSVINLFEVMISLIFSSLTSKFMLQSRFEYYISSADSSFVMLFVNGSTPTAWLWVLTPYLTRRPPPFLLRYVKFSLISTCFDTMLMSGCLSRSDRVSSCFLRSATAVVGSVNRRRDPPPVLGITDLKVELLLLRTSVPIGCV